MGSLIRRRTPRVPARLRAALLIAVLAALGGLGLHASSVTWNIDDIFVGFDNQFGGGDPNPAHWRVFDPAGPVKDDVSQIDDPSYVSACAFDPNSANVDFWTTGYWDNMVRHYDGAAPHALLQTLDLSPFTNGGAVSSIVFTHKSSGERGFYVSATYTKPTPVSPDQTNIFYFKVPASGPVSTTPDATFTVNTSGYRGVDWIDLSADQHTLFYSSLDDNGLVPSVIRRFDLDTQSEGATIHLTTDGSTPLTTKVLAFRMLPPGDGSGGFMVASDTDVFRVDPNGIVKAGFTQNADFRQQMASRGLPTDYSFFIDTNITNDGEYVWAAAYPQFDDTNTADPVSGNEIYAVTTPGKLFKFHIPTGTVQAGPFDLGAAGDREFADAICLKREYVASVEQPPCPSGSTDYRCSPPPDCTDPQVKASSPHCQVPGAPTITALVDQQSAPFVTYPNPDSSTLVTNSEHDPVQLRIQAVSGIADPSVAYSLDVANLPRGLSFDPSTGLISGTVGYDAAGICGPYCAVSVTATNTAGRSTSTTFHWRIDESNFPPVVDPLGALTYQHGVAIAPFSVSATDLDPGDGISFEFQPPVPGLSFGPTPVSGSRTQTISGTPTIAPGLPCPADICSVTATVLFADDRKGSPVSATQSTPLVVTILNAPPTMVQPPDQTSRPGVPVSIQVNASDPNGDLLAYSIVTNPPSSGLLISQAGVITGSPAAGSYGVIVTAADGHGDSVSKTFTIRVSENSAPVCSLAVASPAQLWPPNHKFDTVSVRGVTDPDGDATTIRFTRILQDEPTLPSGHLDGDGCRGHHHVAGDEWDSWGDNGSGNTSIDGIISGPNRSIAQVRAEREGTSDGRVYELLFTATDTAGNSCTGTVKVGVPHDQGGMPAPIDSLVRYDSTVAGGAPLQGPPYNLAPLYANPGDQTTSVNRAVTLATTATDKNLDPLTYSAAGLPAGLSIQAHTGLVSGTPGVPGVYMTTLTASDPYGGSSSVTFKWTVVANRAPIAVSDATTIGKGGSVTAYVLRNDSDPDGDPIRITGIAGSYNGTAAITSNGTTITYRPSNNFRGTTQFAYTISDGRGGTATATLRVDVSSHRQGDNCDHERHRNGHYEGDGCEHERACTSSHH